MLFFRLLHYTFSNSNDLHYDGKPLLLYQAGVIKHSYRRILLLLVPISLISTPIGQLVTNRVPTKIIQAVAGVLVTFTACCELYDKINRILGGERIFCRCASKTDANDDEVNKTGCSSNSDDQDKQEEKIAAIGDTNHDVEEGKRDVIVLPKEDVGVLVVEDSEADCSDEKETDKVTESDCDEEERSVILKQKYRASEEKDNSESEHPQRCSEKEEDEHQPTTTAIISVGAPCQTNDTQSSSVSVMPSHQETHTSSSVKELMIIGFNKATFITIIAGGTSGFLGGMVAIPGPPLIFYFLHPPHPVTFDKNTQRATGSVVLFTNVLMRQIFYLINTFSFSGQSNKIGYVKDDWLVYLWVIVWSIAGGLLGDQLFRCVKDSKDTIRGILAVFLFMCGVSLLFSAFL